jgi:hypothetical protein
MVRRTLGGGEKQSRTMIPSKFYLSILRAEEDGRSGVICGTNRHHVRVPSLAGESLSFGEEMAAGAQFRPITVPPGCEPKHCQSIDGRAFVRLLAHDDSELATVVGELMTRSDAPENERRSRIRQGG